MDQLKQTTTKMNDQQDKNDIFHGQKREKKRSIHPKALILISDKDGETNEYN